MADKAAAMPSADRGAVPLAEPARRLPPLSLLLEVAADFGSGAAAGGSAKLSSGNSGAPAPLALQSASQQSSDAAPVSPDAKLPQRASGVMPQRTDVARNVSDAPAGQGSPPQRDDLPVAPVPAAAAAVSPTSPHVHGHLELVHGHLELSPVDSASNDASLSQAASVISLSSDDQSSGNREAPRQGSPSALSPSQLSSGTLTGLLAQGMGAQPAMDDGKPASQRPASASPASEHSSPALAQAVAIAPEAPAARLQNTSQPIQPTRRWLGARAPLGELPTGRNEQARSAAHRVRQAPSKQAPKVVLSASLITISDSSEDSQSPRRSDSNGWGRTSMQDENSDWRPSVAVRKQVC